MIITNIIYHTWLHKLQQSREHENKARLRAFAFLMAGLYASSSVHLSKIARKLPGKATKNSTARRLMRILNNRHIQVRAWYKPIATDLLQAIANHGLEVRLLVDGSKVSIINGRVVLQKISGMCTLYKNDGNTYGKSIQMATLSTRNHLALRSVVFALFVELSGPRRNDDRARFNSCSHNHLSLGSGLCTRN